MNKEVLLHLSLLHWEFTSITNTSHNTIFFYFDTFRAILWEEQPHSPFSIPSTAPSSNSSLPTSKTSGNTNLCVDIYTYYTLMTYYCTRKTMGQWKIYMCAQTVGWNCYSNKRVIEENKKLLSLISLVRSEWDCWTDTMHAACMYLGTSTSLINRPTNKGIEANQNQSFLQ